MTIVDCRLSIEKNNYSVYWETFDKCSISFKIKARESRFSGINHRNILDISSPASAG